MRAFDLKIVIIFCSILFLTCQPHASHADVEVDWSALDDVKAKSDDDQPMKLKVKDDGSQTETPAETSSSSSDDATSTTSTEKSDKDAEIDKLLAKYRSNSKPSGEYYHPGSYEDDAKKNASSEDNEVENKYSFKVKFNEENRIIKPSVPKTDYASSDASTPYSSPNYKSTSSRYQSSYTPYNYSGSYSSADEPVSDDEYQKYMDSYRRVQKQAGGKYSPYQSDTRKQLSRSYDDSNFDDEYSTSKGPSMIRPHAVEEVKQETIADETVSKAPIAPIASIPTDSSSASTIAPVQNKVSTAAVKDLPQAPTTIKPLVAPKATSAVDNTSIPKLTMPAVASKINSTPTAISNSVNASKSVINPADAKAIANTKYDAKRKIVVQQTKPVEEKVEAPIAKVEAKKSTTVAKVIQEPKTITQTSSLAKEITAPTSNSKSEVDSTTSQEQKSKEITSKAFSHAGEDFPQSNKSMTAEEEKVAAEKERLKELEKDTLKKMVEDGEAKKSGVKSITASVSKDQEASPDETELKNVSANNSSSDEVEPNKDEAYLPEVTSLKKSSVAQEGKKIASITQPSNNVYAQQAAKSIGDKMASSLASAQQSPNTAEAKMASLMNNFSAGNNKPTNMTQTSNPAAIAAANKSIKANDSNVAKEDKKFIEPANAKETLSTVEFGRDSSDLTSSSKDELARVAELLTQSPNIRVQIQAFSYSKDKTKSDARRMSLSRGLVVRSFLTDKGIKPVRLDIRALGDQTQKTPIDRVDIVFLD